MFTYMPHAEYNASPGVIKRINVPKEGFPLIDNALAYINEREKKKRLLFAWINVLDGRQRVDTIKLQRLGDRWVATHPTVQTATQSANQFATQTADQSATPDETAMPSEVSTSAKTSTPDEMPKPSASATAPKTTDHTPDYSGTKTKTRHYSTATKLAMVERVKAEGISRVARETGITAVTLRAWRRQVEEGKLVADATHPFHVSTPTEATVDAPGGAVEVREATVYAPGGAVEEHTVVRVDTPVEEHTSEQFNGNAVQLSIMGDEPVSIQHKKRTHYSLETKLKALSRVREIGVAAAAHELGITRSMIYRWQKEANLASLVSAAPDTPAPASPPVPAPASSPAAPSPASPAAPAPASPAVPAPDTPAPLPSPAAPATPTSPSAPLPYPAPSVGFATEGITPSNEISDAQPHNGLSQREQNNGGDSSTSTTPSDQGEKHVYTDEEKLAILDMVATDGFVTVSKELGIPKSTLRSWKRRAKRGLITSPIASAPSITEDMHEDGDKKTVLQHEDRETVLQHEAEDKETVLQLAAELGVEAVAQEMGIPIDVIESWRNPAPATEEQSTTPVVSDIESSRQSSPMKGFEELTQERMLNERLIAENAELKLQVQMLETKLARYKKAIEALMEN